MIGPAAAASMEALAAAVADPNEYVSAAAAHGVEVVAGTYAPAP
jgi:hypothetical protein